jgi:DnaK suppressor protein
LYSREKLGNYPGSVVRQNVNNLWNRDTLSRDAALDPNEMPDEIDQASAEYEQSFIFRIRDREKYYLSKVQKALAKIEAGTFGICEACDEPVAIKRMEARPVTTLCIRCKEEQEMEERSYN